METSINEQRERIKKVKTLVQEVDGTHRYSMSRVYGLYNEIFEKKETPQSCASCLIRKVNELKKWLANAITEYKEVESSIGLHSTPIGNYEEVIEKVEKPKRKRKEGK